MKRWLLFLLVCFVASAFADDYVDDVYFTEKAAVEQHLKDGDLQPYYNKKQMQEIEFIVDSIPPSSSDTIASSPLP